MSTFDIAGKDAQVVGSPPPPPPPARRFVDAPPEQAVISIYAPLADPPCSKKRMRFCHASIVIPVPDKVVPVAGLESRISPPSSPAEFVALK